MSRFNRAEALARANQARSTTNRTAIGGDVFDVEIAVPRSRPQSTQNGDSAPPNRSRGQRSMPASTTSTSSRILKQRIDAARTSGTLNLRGLGLTEWPDEVAHMYEQPVDDAAASKWWEAVDLQVIDAAGNKLHDFPEAILAIATTVHTLTLDNNMFIDATFAKDFFLSLPLLRSLSLDDNRLTRVPSSLCAAQALAELSLRNNAIELIPQALLSRTLTRLSLSGNRIVGVAADVACDPPAWQRLLALDLSHNLLGADAGASQTAVVAGNAALALLMGALRDIQRLDLSHNQLCSPLPSFAALTSLAELDLSYNAIQVLPPLPTPPAQPRSAGRAKPGSSAVPPGLRVLSAGYNALTNVATIVDARALATVSLNDNQLSSLPPGLSALSALAALNLANNNLADLPSELGFLEALVRVQLDGNPLRSVPRAKREGVHALKQYLRARASHAEADALDTATGAAVVPANAVLRAIHDGTAARAVSLSGLGLSALPAELLAAEVMEPLCLWGALTTLDLSRNSLPGDALDALLRTPHVQSLQSLSLAGCGLDAVPAAVLSMPALRTLDLSNNKLTTHALTRFLLAMSQARAGEAATHVPAPAAHVGASGGTVRARGIALLPDVTVAQNALSGVLCVPRCAIGALDVSRNRLEAVDVAQVHGLRALHVADNKLSELPRIADYADAARAEPARARENGTNGYYLELLDASNNDISAVDPLVAHPLLHPALTTLSLAGNPIKVLRASIVTAGATAVLRALRARLDPALLAHPSPLWAASGSADARAGDEQLQHMRMSSARAGASSYTHAEAQARTHARPASRPGGFTDGAAPGPASVLGWGDALVDGVRAIALSAPHTHAPTQPHGAPYPASAQWADPLPASRATVGSRAGAPGRHASARESALATQWDYPQPLPPHATPHAPSQPLPRRAADARVGALAPTGPTGGDPQAAPGASANMPQRAADTQNGNNREAFLRNRARAYGSTSLW